MGKRASSWREAFLALQAFALTLAFTGGRVLHPWVGTRRLGDSSFASTPENMGSLPVAFRGGGGEDWVS